MSDFELFSKGLKKYLPQKALSSVAKLLVEQPVYFKIVPPRKTKFGDFKVRNKQFIITVNADLNPFAFLITTLHEIAHLKTYLNFKHTVKPHGIEWKKQFQELLIPFYKKNIFPNEINEALFSYINNPKASSCSDKNLYKALKKYDKNAHTKIFLEDLIEGDKFRFNNYCFIKGKKRRTRFSCFDVSTGKEYTISGLAEVSKYIQ